MNPAISITRRPSSLRRKPILLRIFCPRHVRLHDSRGSRCNHPAAQSINFFSVPIARKPFLSQIARVYRDHLCEGKPRLDLSHVRGNGIEQHSKCSPLVQSCSMVAALCLNPRSGIRSPAIRYPSPPKSFTIDEERYRMPVSEMKPSIALCTGLRLDSRGKHRRAPPPKPDWSLSRVSGRAL